MVMMKRKRGGRATGRRKRMRRTYVPRPIRSSGKAVIAMRKVCYTGAWTFSSLSTNGFWRYQTYNVLNATQNWPELQAVFDEFKINAIKVTFRPRYDMIDGADASGGNTTTYAHVIVDPASITAPSGTYTAANLNTLLESDGVKTYNCNKPFSVYFRPKVQDSIFGGGTSSRVITPTFIKTDQTGVDFRGFHIFLQQNNFSSASTTFVLDQFVTLYMQMRNLR